ncbi:MAG: SOS response-associated peptidase [Cyclobacteriaceae bacterium]
MIDRYTIKCDSSELEQAFQLDHFDNWSIRYNAAPTQLLPVSTQNNPKAVQLFTWGLMSRLANNKKLSPKLFNLPLESALTKPSYKKTMTSRRCIIYADGFYVWKPISKKKLIPYYAHTADGSPFSMAGIWEEKDEFDDQSTQTFMLISVPSSRDIAPYQSDMPLILDSQQKNAWLSQNTDIQQFQNYSANQSFNLAIHPVSPLIANVEVDHVDLIKPTNPSDQHGNYTLFG